MTKIFEFENWKIWQKCKILDFFFENKIFFSILTKNDKKIFFFVFFVPVNLACKIFLNKNQKWQKFWLVNSYHFFKNFEFWSFTFFQNICNFLVICGFSCHKWVKIWNIFEKKKFCIILSKEKSRDLKKAGKCQKYFYKIFLINILFCSKC